MLVDGLSQQIINYHYYPIIIPLWIIHYWDKPSLLSTIIVDHLPLLLWDKSIYQQIIYHGL